MNINESIVYLAIFDNKNFKDIVFVDFWNGFIFCNIYCQIQVIGKKMIITFYLMFQVECIKRFKGRCRERS